MLPRRRCLKGAPALSVLDSASSSDGLRPDAIAAGLRMCVVGMSMAGNVFYFCAAMNARHPRSKSGHDPPAAAATAARAAPPPATRFDASRNAALPPFWGGEAVPVAA